MTKEEKAFWEKFKRWHLESIDRCIANDVNFGAATLILITIDALGGFYKGLIEKEVEEIYKCKKCGSQKKIRKKKWLVRVGGNRVNPAKKIYSIDGIKYEESNSRDVFVNFIKNYMRDFFKEVQEGTKKKRAVEILYSHFRNGLVHESGPKIGTGVYRSYSPELFKSYPKQKIFMAINLLSFRDRFVKAFYDYEKDLFNEKQPERLKRWRDRFDYLKTTKF